MLLVFVESYGRVAVQAAARPRRPRPGPGDQPAGAAGYSTRSGLLDSSTFGGTSWLAHSTLQAGVWVDSQRRYDQLSRPTGSPSAAPSPAPGGGPSSTSRRTARTGRRDAFYGYDQVYDARNLGYAGPPFGYATCPTSTPDGLCRPRADTRRTAPVMAEIDLVSSHAPWTPLPEMVDWDALGDGSVYADPRRAATGRRSGATRPWCGRPTADDRLLDRQPAGSAAGHEQPRPDPARRPPAVTPVIGKGREPRVPISIISHDPAVTGGIAAWGWNPGLRPSQLRPGLADVSGFRNRVLATFGPGTGTPVETTR